MTVRTRKKEVTFARPFVLGGLDEVLPAGAYIVETDERRVNGVSFLAYRRISTRIHLPAASGNPALGRTLITSPEALEAAVMRDQAPAEVLADTDTDSETL
jgi:hypothetical protein